MPQRLACLFHRCCCAHAVLPAPLSLAQVKSFLTSETLEHFISTHQKPLTVIDTLSSIGTALQLLQTKRVLSVPVVDEVRPRHSPGLGS